MRPILFLALSLMTAAPALAWIPKLDDTTARAVIDGAYGRQDAPPTYLNIDLSVDNGKFKSDGAVKAFDGGDACVSGWLSAPTAYDKSGSRPTSLTLSGQADQLAFQAATARDNFKSLTAEDALKDATSRMPDGQIRLDLMVAGLKDQKQRSAYLVRLKGPDGKLIAPVKASYVNDWKADASGRFGGTLVYYFEPTKAGINANDKVDILIRTEASSNCAYAVNFDLGQFY
ncbi:hypothetical protein MF271_02700 [Deinococcus sp. KNUC1210]|uniref:hypothetical protein n=1 Tax=Deinococcus sp. KNUC1210 TaxID=2917691 RepID=UPI001EF07D3D|nr:hypothetical protein [Deinococcus sp. KNUC1210]ULH15577.1 hypothetical protein MF271_02700 [Deinococcus sp. KNUC1210]